MLLKVSNSTDAMALAEFFTRDCLEVAPKKNKPVKDTGSLESSPSFRTKEVSNPGRAGLYEQLNFKKLGISKKEIFESQLC